MNIPTDPVGSINARTVQAFVERERAAVPTGPAAHGGSLHGLGTVSHRPPVSFRSQGDRLSSTFSLAGTDLNRIRHSKEFKKCADVDRTSIPSGISSVGIYNRRVSNSSSAKNDAAAADNGGAKRYQRSKPVRGKHAGSHRTAHGRKVGGVAARVCDSDDSRDEDYVLSSDGSSSERPRKKRDSFETKQLGSTEPPRYVPGEDTYCAGGEPGDDSQKLPEYVGDDDVFFQKWKSVLGISPSTGTGSTPEKPLWMREHELKEAVADAVSPSASSVDDGDVHQPGDSAEEAGGRFSPVSSAHPAYGSAPAPAAAVRHAMQNVDYLFPDAHTGSAGSVASADSPAHSTGSGGSGGSSLSRRQRDAYTDGADEMSESAASAASHSFSSRSMSGVPQHGGGEGATGSDRYSAVSMMDIISDGVSGNLSSEREWCTSVASEFAGTALLHKHKPRGAQGEMRTPAHPSGAGTDTATSVEDESAGGALRAMMRSARGMLGDGRPSSAAPAYMSKDRLEHCIVKLGNFRMVAGRGLPSAVEKTHPADPGPGKKVYTAYAAAKPGVADVYGRLGDASESSDDAEDAGDAESAGAEEGGTGAKGATGGRKRARGVDMSVLGNPNLGGELDIKCAGCMSDVPIEGHVLHDLTDMIDSCAPSMSLSMLAKSVHLFYKNRVLKPQIRAGVAVVPMTQMQWMEHLLFHTDHQIVQNKYYTAQIKEMLKVASENAIVIDKNTGKRHLNTKMAEVIMKLHNHARAMQSLKIKSDKPNVDSGAHLLSVLRPHMRHSAAIEESEFTESSINVTTAKATLRKSMYSTM